MVLIAMCVYSTEENKKDACLRQTLNSLAVTVDLTRHRLFLSINGATNETMGIIQECLDSRPYTIIDNKENLGTAKGINACWKYRTEGEHCLKIDDDIVIESPGWVDILVEALVRDPKIGQIGLKRTDLAQSPIAENKEWRTRYELLPHQPGWRWMTIEVSDDIIGSCVLHSSALIDKTGGLFQGDGNLYGYDDSLKSCVSRLAGFKNCFYPHILIHHVDQEPTPFWAWKRKEAGKMQSIFHKIREEYKNGSRSLYTPL